MRGGILTLSSACALATSLALSPVAGASPGSVVTHRLLVSAAPLAGANGMTFGVDGALYVGSIESREIVKMDPDSGKILARFGPEEGFEGADDVATGPDGAIYYTALTTGEVGKIEPDGSHATVATLPLGVNAIAFSDNGRLFIGLAVLGDALYEVDPAGVKPPRLITTGLGLNGFAWLGGYLYAPRMFTGELVRIDVDTGASTVVAGGFTLPDAVDVDSQGRLYVLDQGPGQVVRVDPTSGRKRVVATLGGVKDNMAIDARDRLYVSDATDGSVVQVLRNGRVRSVSRGGLGGPDGLAVLPARHGETVYAADLFRLYGFDGRTGRTRTVVAAGDAVTTGLHTPFTVGVYGSNLVVTSWLRRAVTVYDPDGRAVLASCADADVPLNAIGFDGHVVVADLVSHQVTLLDEHTCARTPVAGFPVPTGLATAGGALWVADWASGSVFQVAAGGHFIAPKPVATGLAGPEGLAASPDGGLVVVETFRHRVSHIDLATGNVTPLVEGLDLGAAGPPTLVPIWIFDGIAVGSSGAIYVSAHGLHRYEVHA